MKKTFNIKFICTNFPENGFDGMHQIVLAVQRNKETVEDTSLPCTQKTFLLPVDVKVGKTGEPNLLGPFVHGPTGDRFLYLVWYNLSGNEKHMFRRAKIKLQHLTWENINKAIETKKPIIAEIKLKDKHGCPVCASLKEDNISWRPF